MCSIVIMKPLDRTHHPGHPIKSPFFVFCLVILCGVLSTCFADDEKSKTIPEHGSREPIREERVTIDGTVYQIPPPWLGNRVDAPQLSYSDFRQIPLKFCKDGGSIYVTIETQKRLVVMLNKAEEDGLLIQVESGYRSAAYQKKIFKRMLAAGRTFEDIVRYVAPPGYSNHMLGTAVDFSPSNWRFADTEHYQWLQENAHHFGFEETYSQTNIHRMLWESWHWQYTGISISAQQEADK